MLAEHKKCVPLSCYKSWTGLAHCELNADILSGPDASLTSSLLSVTFGGMTTAEVISYKLKAQSSMNNSPGDRSMVYCHPGKHSTVPFGKGFNDLGQRKRRSIHGRTNYYGFHYIFVTPERLGWVFFHLSSYNHRQRHPSCLLTTGVLVEQPSVLQWGPWAWVGWTQLLDNCKAQVSRISHTPSCSSTKALPVLSPCRSTCILESPVVQLRKQWQQRPSSTTTYWNYHYTAASAPGQKKAPASLWLDSNHSWNRCLQRTKSMASKHSSPFTVASQWIPASGARHGFAHIFRCRVMVCDHNLPPDS